MTSGDGTSGGEPPPPPPPPPPPDLKISATSTSAENLEKEEEEKIKSTLGFKIIRSCIVLVFSLSSFFLLSLSVLYLAVTIANLSIWNPISVPSQCRIVSSSVDLRSSKVCELGLLNYKAKHVFNPSERKKYRCRYDYYWASVFKVEYIDHSGQSRHAFAEAPNEALPSNCRPNFGVAWSAKDKFKVNETYDCWYMLGISKVNINHDGLFDCQAEYPSTVEMLRRYSILFMRILKSWLLGEGSVGRWRWDIITGLVTGFSTSLISLTVAALLQPLKSLIRRVCAIRKLSQTPSSVLVKRACLFVAYFSFMSWLTIQYAKRLGLAQML